MPEEKSTIKDWIQSLSNPTCNPWQGHGPDRDPVDPEKATLYPPLDEIERIRFSNDTEGLRFNGDLDELGRFHDSGMVSFECGDTIMATFHHGILDGEAVIMAPRINVARLCGNFVLGKLQGPGRIVSNDTSVTECFFKDNVIHGLVRKFEMKKFREFRQQVCFLGLYKNGRPHGLCWQHLEGGGFIVGDVDSLGEFTGKDIAYIYPDFKTAWRGHFVSGQMKSAVPVEVAGVVEMSGEILRPKFSRLSDRSAGYSKSSRTSMGENILVPDPYESEWIVVKESGIEGAGEGLFARKDLEAGQVVAFYNGVRIPYELGGPKEEWSTSGYKIFINADYISGERMNIPDEFVGLDKYSATLGHKMNHSFEPNCAEWFYDHPRFGVIPCMRTLTAISAGQELLLDYEYDPYNCPDWFKHALEDHVQRASDDQLGDLNAKYVRFIVNECERKISGFQFVHPSCR